MYYGVITMYCPNCGTETNPDSEFCQKCGTNLKEGTRNTCVPPNVTYALPLKSTGLAAVLSFLLAGLGQVYVGKIARGIGFIVCGVVIALVMMSMITIFISSYGAVWIIAVIASIVCIAIWIFNVIDAYKLANEYNDVLQQTGNPPW